MKIEEIEFYNIRSFKNASIEILNDIIVVGQNDHGKSSIFKVLDVIFNKLEKAYFETDQALPEDIFNVINPAISSGNSAKRIKIWITSENKPLILTFKEGSITVFRGKPERGKFSDPKALLLLFNLLQNYSFIHIPAARDVNSSDFLSLFRNIMQERGLKEIIPKVGGGTRKEYRLLKNIRSQLKDDITPFLDENILPQIKQNLPYDLPYDLKINFQIDLNKLISWVNESLSLGVLLQTGSNIIPISELGSGIQSLLMLALQRVLALSELKRGKNFILAIEEPEAFLHPQAQRNISDFLKKEVSKKDNVKLLISTHSPYILNSFNLSNVKLVKKVENYSKIYVPEIKTEDSEVLNDYNNEINSEIFFANAVLFVEGESDKRVFYKLLFKVLNIFRGDITIIDVGGNKSFSPYLRLINSLNKAEIPWGLVTDFDSILKNSGERPLLKGLEDGGIKMSRTDFEFIAQNVNKVIDKDEADYVSCAKSTSAILKKLGVNAFIFPCDLEWSLCSQDIKDDVVEILKDYFNSGSSDLNLNQIRKKIGSKGIPNASPTSSYKKPFIHEKIAEKITRENIYPNMFEALNFIKSIIET